MAVLTLCGKDVIVTIGGGDTPHIGAAALASSRPSLKDDGGISATASVLCAIGHKEDVISRETALRLASKLNTTVLVSVGLHLDNPVSNDIELMKMNFQELIDKTEDWLIENKR